jgi:hypothetical protein
VPGFRHKDTTGETKTGESHWFCKTSHFAKRHTSEIIIGTGLSLKDMKEVHQLTEKQSCSSLTTRNRDIVHGLITGFNLQKFKTMLHGWISHDNIAFNQVQSPNFLDLILELDESFREHNCLPTHRYIQGWIMKNSEGYEGVIARHIYSALGKVCMSFNL